VFVFETLGIVEEIEPEEIEPMSATQTTAFAMLPHTPERAMAAAAPKPLPRHTRATGAFATTSLKVVLGLSGAFTVFTGLNRAFGGIRTLGWQGTTDFLQVVSEHAYLIQDNHTRFLGGVWTGVGLLLMLSPLNLKAFRPALNLVFAIIFLGGLARFTAMRPDIVFGPDIVGSLIAELVGMPLLWLWVSKAVQASDH
jgi:Domain of unknown function (DUF4345)